MYFWASPIEPIAEELHEESVVLNPRCDRDFDPYMFRTFLLFPFLSKGRNAVVTRWTLLTFAQKVETRSVLWLTGSASAGQASNPTMRIPTHICVTSVVVLLMTPALLIRISNPLLVMAWTFLTASLILFSSVAHI